MKIKSLYISNVLSFKYVEEINDAQKIVFDKNLNILIGQNGAGKSTVLEIINFVFRRVLFIPYNRNQDLYKQKLTINTDQKRSILSKINDVQYYRNFRLDKNYNFEDKPQKIRVIIEIDEIDRANMALLQDNKEKLTPIVGFYSGEQMFGENTFVHEYQLDITLSSSDTTFTIDTQQDFGYTYLSAYNLYKEVISLYNEENPDDQISNLSESFALIGCYRNYNSYADSASLGGGNTALKQIQSVLLSECSRSTNAAEIKEPTIFSLVRLKMAERCFNLIETAMDKDACQREANELEFIKLINEKLKIVNIRIEIKLVDVSSWSFSFLFVDTKRGLKISDINSLSAGQKAIIHLVFEAYGRGSLRGGLVIIDEPEIHLHYQFQNEYLRVIEKLNEEQGCQYILVTHSESLITSKTIANVIRLALNEDRYTNINQPNISTEQKWLVKILDNTRSTHAFFGGKVVLVEGEDDRYFFRSALEELEKSKKIGLVQDVTILDIEGKGKSDVWRELFESFGLKIFVINDLDWAFKYYPGETAKKINSEELVREFLSNHGDVIARIESEYSNGIFTLKQGALELYIGIHNKGLSSVIKFCHDNMRSYFADDTNAKAEEIKMIINRIITQ